MNPPDSEDCRVCGSGLDVDDDSGDAVCEDCRIEAGRLREHERPDPDPWVET